MAEYTTHIKYYPQNASCDLDDTYPGILGAKVKVHQDFDLDELTLGFSGPSQFIRTQLRTAGHLDTKRSQHTNYQDKIRIMKGYCIR